MLRAFRAPRTIHQPRSSVWAMIEDVVLMGPGGRAVFCGSRDEILEHLGRQGHSCPVRGVNPADFIIDLVSVHSTGQEAVEDQQRIDRPLGESYGLGALGA